MEQNDSALNALTQWAKRADSGFTVSKPEGLGLPPQYVLTLLDSPATFNGESGRERVAKIINHFKKAGLESSSAFARAITGPDRWTILVDEGQKNFKAKLKKLLETAINEGMPTAEESNALQVQRATRKIIPVDDDGIPKSKQQAQIAIAQAIIKLQEMGVEMGVDNGVSALIKSQLPSSRGR